MHINEQDDYWATERCLDMLFAQEHPDNIAEPEACSFGCHGNHQA